MKLPPIGTPCCMVYGTLSLLENERTINSFKALSGAQGFQSKSHLWARGRGPLPPWNYVVSPNPIDLKHIKGIEGTFYRVFPYEIHQAGVTRGDFGIHRDANVPGSAGCIVLPTKLGWPAFQREMKRISSTGEIPLHVVYS